MTAKSDAEGELIALVDGELRRRLCNSKLTGLSRFGYPKSDIYTMWYKDPAIDDLSSGLVQFIGDRDALEMIRIAIERRSVELYVVHEHDNQEVFPEIGYIDVGGDEAGNAGDGGDEAINAGVDGEGVPNGENEGAAAVNGGGEGDGGPNGEIEGAAVADNAEGGVEAEAGVATEEAATNDTVEAGGKDLAGEADEAATNDVVKGGIVDEERPSEERAVPNEEDVGAGLGEEVSEGVVENLNEVQNEDPMEDHNEVENDDHSEDTIEDEEYVSSDVPSDSADDVHLTDSEEDFNLGDDFFGNETGAGSSGVGNRGKSVANDEFSDGGDESEELEDGHAVGGDGDESDEDGRRVFLVHKEVPNMASYSWQVGLFMPQERNSKMQLHLMLFAHNGELPSTSVIESA
ncbi:hypothetical protein PIB30_033871 [Stylosanthes scabra]|uniref:Uncharacterized protein n=1 Tax=Stylosanthes scabra TaxID=79078 RepID=A0ABU6SD76_9FABA|nr:hypothetical protein [Stylosanthes scabra]